MKYKTMIIKAIGIFLSLCLISITSISALADEEKNVNITIKEIESIKENSLIIQEKTEGLSYKKTIENIDKFKLAIKQKYPQIDEYQLGKAILLSLGDSEETIAELPKEKVLEAVNYKSVVITECYLEETKDGELIEISKQKHENNRAILKAPYNNSQTFGDIVLRSYAYKWQPLYALSGRSYFVIRGNVEWVGYPNFQMKDLLTVSSSGNIDNNYLQSASGLWKHPSLGTQKYDSASLSNKGSFISLSTPSIHGIGATFPIGVGQSGQLIVNNVYCYYGISSQKDVSCQVSYAHAILAWTPSFSVSSGGSVSFGGLGIQRQVFNGTAFTLYH